MVRPTLCPDCGQTMHLGNRRCWVQRPDPCANALCDGPARSVLFQPRAADDGGTIGIALALCGPCARRMTHIGPTRQWWWWLCVASAVTVTVLAGYAILVCR